MICIVSEIHRDDHPFCCSYITTESLLENGFHQDDSLYFKKKKKNSVQATSPLESRTLVPWKIALWFRHIDGNYSESQYSSPIIHNYRGMLLWFEQPIGSTRSFGQCNWRSSTGKQRMDKPNKQFTNH